MTASGFIQQFLLAGVIATATLDLWQWLVQLVFSVPATNWALVGRWFSYIPRGTLIHDGIGNARPVRFETMTGWVAHYAIGLIYAATYLALVSRFSESGPAFLSAFGFSVITVVAPWFVLQPGMGLGVLARKAPKPGIARIHSLSSHAAFGIGLYLGSLAFGAVA